MFERSICPMFVIATMLVCSSVSPGQAVGGSVVIAFRCGEHAPPLPTFTATWKITTVHKQKQSFVITNVRTVKAATDSVGRAYNETHWMVPIRPAPGAPDPFFASVFDPLRHVLIKWNSGSTEAVVFHEPRPLQPANEKPEPQPSEADCAEQPPLPPPAPDPAVEKLGPKTILGMEATGTRFSTLQSTDPGGNGKWITVIEESWSSADYGVEVLRIVRYPDGSYEKSELVNYEKGAPDSALFEVPEGYVVRDVYQDARP